jgi:Antibiotic biosynthesis monooxygenase
MITIVDSLPDREGLRIVESWCCVQNTPGFVSMQVLRSEDGDEHLVITRSRDRASFDAWLRSEELSLPYALTVRTLTTVK